MLFTKESFILAYQRGFSETLSKPLKSSTSSEQYEVLVKLVAEQAAIIRAAATEHAAPPEKQVFYFSMEFLVGRLLENYLINLGVRDTVEQGLKELGISLDELLALEPDPGLGNGGLGRLAACFLDSMAVLGVAGTGMGVRYRYGLFRQRINSGFQEEEPDAWLENGYPWECAHPDEAIEIRFGGEVERHMEDGELTFKHKNYHSINAVPYDIPIVGYGGKTVNFLRLWNAQPIREQFDMDAFNRGDYAAAFRDKAETDAVTCILYPDDSTLAGRQLRLKQEYFLVAAGIGSIIRNYKQTYGADWAHFADRISIHTNDTHPALCAAELIRLLLDEEDLPWETAWEITRKVCSFTNHTVLPEALEKWPVDMMQHLLPRVYMIVEEIDRRYRDSFDRSQPGWQDQLARTAILWDGQVRMANLSIICSSHVNGVAALHTEILKQSVFHDFYALRPEIFSNKTNGVSHRRFMVQSNPDLAALITEAIGERWIRDAEELNALQKFEKDAAFLQRLAVVKRRNKERLAGFIGNTMEIAIDPDSIFDVQVKRIHAYKRQLLGAFKILNLYNQLRENPTLDIPPHTFVFAGKAAQGYALAKEIIKFVCSVADLVNGDPEISKILKVVFVENFNISNAQLIYPAADISEQISTAGKEASGTGNMKFMFNGAVTLGTLDGANVEIRDHVGEDNIFIFGLKAEEAMAHHLNRTYRAQDVLNRDPRLSTMLQQLVNGFFSKSGYEFWRIYDSLLQENDEFFVLEDFDSYVQTWEKMGQLYGSPAWNRISLHNIAKAGFFSSDRTIREYCDDIWHVSYQNAR